VTSRVLVALRVPGSAERAFQVFTEEIGAWWRPSPLFAFTPRSPGVMAFEPPCEDGPGRFVERLANGRTFVIGEITAWEPGRRLAFAWRQASFAPDETTRVEVRFEPVGDETRVTVEHTGWDSVPPVHVARHALPEPVFSRRLADWWRGLLVSMGERL
jgi:uncharacterized protein YndB with AHSA1/START domain